MQLEYGGSCRAIETYVVQGRTVMEIWMYDEKQGFSKCKSKSMSALPRIAPGKYIPEQNKTLREFITKARKWGG